MPVRTAPDAIYKRLHGLQLLVSISTARRYEIHVIDLRSSVHEAGTNFTHEMPFGGGRSRAIVPSTVQLTKAGRSSNGSKTVDAPENADAARYKNCLKWGGHRQDTPAENPGASRLGEQMIVRSIGSVRSHRFQGIVGDLERRDRRLVDKAPASVPN